MNQLCLFTGLSDSDLAAWVQAIGSIAAVGAAVWIALWQSRKQHQASLALLKAERDSAKLEMAKAVQRLSTGALIALDISNRSFPDPDAIVEIAEGKKFYDLGELGVIENAILGIPLHSLPHELVRLNMIASSSIRQYHRAIKMALSKGRAMTEQDLKGFFETLYGATDELSKTCIDIDAEIARLENS